MPGADFEYYSRRASEQARLAQEAREEKRLDVVKAHNKLVQHYTSKAILALHSMPEHEAVPVDGRRNRSLAGA